MLPQLYAVGPDLSSSIASKRAVRSVTVIYNGKITMQHTVLLRGQSKSCIRTTAPSPTTVCLAAFRWHH